jgi:hypothetical protein
LICAASRVRWMCSLSDAVIIASLIIDKQVVANGVTIYWYI